MPSRTLLIDGSSTSSPDGGIVQPPVTPYHVIYMSDPCDVNRPTCHINFATGGEILSTISGRAASVIIKRKHTFERATQKSDIATRARDESMQPKIQMSLNQAVLSALRGRERLKSSSWVLTIQR